MKKIIQFFACAILLLAVPPSFGGEPSQKGKLPLVSVLNVQTNQKISEGYTMQLRMTAQPEVKKIEIWVNGQMVGQADFNLSQKQYRFLYTFRNSGDYDLKIIAISEQDSYTKTLHLEVVPALELKSEVGFDSYILKAVEQLYKEYGWRGYNIHEELTHNVPYGSYGHLPSSNGRQTMCVAGVLETIVTAMNIYANETGETAVFDFLPFDSWRWLRNDTIKAHIWVDEAGLASYGTADAVAKFGMGEHVSFRDLEPGMFMNLNYDDGGGHAVVFMNFLDSTGNDLLNYDADKVKGFRYFGAQGQAEVGKGGFGFRHAFFHDGICPETPYPQDCRILFSESQKVLNTGKILAPSEWRQPDIKINKNAPKRDTLRFSLKKFKAKHWD